MNHKLEVEQEVKRVLEERSDRIIQAFFNVFFTIISLAASWTWITICIYLLPKMIVDLSLTHTQTFVISLGIAGGSIMPLLCLFSYLGFFKGEKK